MGELVVRNLTKKYGSLTVVNNVSFEIRNGEFLSLLGPSGCGKTTTLGAVAGLDRPTSGTIRVGDKICFDGTTGKYLFPEQRNFGLVFQSYALWPHMTVAQNVAFGLKLRKVAKVEQARRVGEILELVEMAPYARRYPHELSGGQQQRVALARTLVYNPEVLLLDEPLSNLDAKLREKARSWLSELQKRVGLTTLYVTHDQIEALALSDRIAVMNKGEIVQLGTPQEIYEKPADEFVADFIGTSNFLTGRVTGSETGTVRVDLANGANIGMATSRSFAAGSDVTVAVRPQSLRLYPRGADLSNVAGTTLPARIVTSAYLGAAFQYTVDIGGGVICKMDSEQHVEGVVVVVIPSEGGSIFERKAAA